MTRTKCQMEEINMDKHLEELYHKAKRFDEGEAYQTEEYNLIAKKQWALCTMMREAFGEDLWVMLQEYVGVVNEEIEFECKHFFAQGYEAGKADN